MKSKLDGLVKSRKVFFSVIPAKAGHVVKLFALSSKFNAFWMPDQVRHDDFEIFYEIVKFNIFHGRSFPQPDIDVKMFISIRLWFGYDAVYFNPC